MNSELLTNGLTLLKQACTIGGGVLAVLGVITVGVNLKDHNGPAVSGGVLQFIGGVLIIAAAQMLLTVA